MFGMKKALARIVAGGALAFVTVVAGAGAAEAGTISLADCLATPGTTVVNHGAWTGCHGPGMGPSGTKIV